MLPQPIRPSVLPVTSTPMKRFFSHLPAWVEALASGSWRASANISAMACSAVVIELPNGRVHHHDALRRGGGDVDIVDADPGAADDLEVGRGVEDPCVTLVAERIARPSYSPMIAFSSSGVWPVLTSTSMPRSRKIARGVGVHLVGNEDFGLGRDSVDIAVTVGEGPVEPRTERFDIGGVDGRAAPDAQARRGVAVTGDVVGAPSLLEQLRESA